MQWVCWVLGPVLRKQMQFPEELTVYWRKETSSQKITIQYSNARTDTDTQKVQREHRERHSAHPAGCQERIPKAGDAWAESQGVSKTFPKKQERVFQVEGMAEVKAQR